jgi:hypothetical protein
VRAPCCRCVAAFGAHAGDTGAISALEGASGVAGGIDIAAPGVVGNTKLRIWAVVGGGGVVVASGDGRGCFHLHQSGLEHYLQQVLCSVGECNESCRF